MYLHVSDGDLASLSRLCTEKLTTSQQQSLSNQPVVQCISSVAAVHELGVRLLDAYVSTAAHVTATHSTADSVLRSRYTGCEVV